MENVSRTKTCSSCGRSFHGRLNQYYCSEKCRINFNNEIARAEKYQINPVLKILLKNREILKDIFESGTTVILKTELLSYKYNFPYHTHQLTSAENAIYIFCFEYGFTQRQDTLTLTLSLIHISEPTRPY